MNMTHFEMMKFTKDQLVTMCRQKMIPFYRGKRGGVANKDVLVDRLLNHSVSEMLKGRRASYENSVEKFKDFTFDEDKLKAMYHEDLKRLCVARRITVSGKNKSRLIQDLMNSI